MKRFISAVMVAFILSHSGPVQANPIWGAIAGIITAAQIGHTWYTTLRSRSEMKAAASWNRANLATKEDLSQLSSQVSQQSNQQLGVVIGQLDQVNNNLFKMQKQIYSLNKNIKKVDEKVIEAIKRISNVEERMSLLQQTLDMKIKEDAANKMAEDFTKAFESGPEHVKRYVTNQVAAINASQDEEDAATRTGILMAIAKSSFDLVVLKDEKLNHLELKKAQDDILDLGDYLSDSLDKITNPYGKLLGFQDVKNEFRKGLENAKSELTNSRRNEILGSTLYDASLDGKEKSSLDAERDRIIGQLPAALKQTLGANPVESDLKNLNESDKKSMDRLFSLNKALDLKQLNELSEKHKQNLVALDKVSQEIKDKEEDERCEAVIAAISPKLKSDYVKAQSKLTLYRLAWAYLDSASPDGKLKEPFEKRIKNVLVSEKAQEQELQALMKLPNNIQLRKVMRSLALHQQDKYKGDASKADFLLHVGDERMVELMGSFEDKVPSMVSLISLGYSQNPYDTGMTPKNAEDLEKEMNEIHQSIVKMDQDLRKELEKGNCVEWDKKLTGCSYRPDSSSILSIETTAFFKSLSEIEKFNKEDYKGVSAKNLETPIAKANKLSSYAGLTPAQLLAKGMEGIGNCKIKSGGVEQFKSQMPGYSCDNEGPVYILEVGAEKKRIGGRSLYFTGDCDASKNRTLVTKAITDQLRAKIKNGNCISILAK